MAEHSPKSAGSSPNEARRRVLLQGVAALVTATAGGLAAWAGVRLSAAKARQLAGEAANVGRRFAVAAADMPGPGEARRVLLGDRRAWLVRHDDGALVVFDAACTHQECTVEWTPAAGRFQCPCHGGAFDGRTGDAVAGPPKRPLRRYIAELTPDGREWVLTQES